MEGVRKNIKTQPRTLSRSKSLIYCSKIHAIIPYHSSFGLRQRAISHLALLNKSCQHLKHYGVRIVSLTTANGKLHKAEKVELERFLVGPKTEFCYVYEKYCFVFGLDMSASMFTVSKLPTLDILQQADADYALPFDQMLPSIRGILMALTDSQAELPGELRDVQPELYVTVIAYCPQKNARETLNAGVEVLVHGLKLRTDVEDICTELFEIIKPQIKDLESGIDSEPGSANLVIRPLVKSAILAVDGHDPACCPGMILLTDGALKVQREYDHEQNPLFELAERDIPCFVLHIHASTDPTTRGDAFTHVPNLSYLSMISKVTNSVLIPYVFIKDMFLDDTHNVSRKLRNVVLLRTSQSQNLSSLGEFEPGSLENTVEIEQKTIATSRNNALIDHQNGRIRSLVSKFHDKTRESALHDYWNLLRKSPGRLVLKEILDYAVSANFFHLVSGRLKDGFILKQIVCDEKRLAIRMIYHWDYDIIVTCIMKTTRKAEFIIDERAPKSLKKRTSSAGKSIRQVDLLEGVAHLADFENSQAADDLVVVRIRLSATPEFHKRFANVGRITSFERTSVEFKRAAKLHVFLNTMQESDRVQVFIKNFESFISDAGKLSFTGTLNKGSDPDDSISIQEYDSLGTIDTFDESYKIHENKINLESNMADHSVHGDAINKKIKQTLLTFSAEPIVRWKKWFTVSSFSILCPDETSRTEICATIVNHWSQNYWYALLFIYDYIKFESSISKRRRAIYALKCFTKEDLSSSTANRNGNRRVGSKNLDHSWLCISRIQFLTENLGILNIATSLSTPTTFRKKLQDELIKAISRPMSVDEKEDSILVSSGALLDAAHETEDHRENYITRKPLYQFAFNMIHSFLDETIEDQNELLAVTEAFSFCKRWNYDVPDGISGKEGMRHIVNSRMREGFLLMGSSFRIESLKRNNADMPEVNFKASTASSLRVDERPKAVFCRIFPAASRNEASGGVQTDECLVLYSITLSGSTCLVIELWIEKIDRDVLIGAHALHTGELFKLLQEHFSTTDGCLISASIEFMHIQSTASSVWDVLLEKDEQHQTKEEVVQVDDTTHVKGANSLLALSSLSEGVVPFLKQTGLDISDVNKELFSFLDRSCERLTDKRIYPSSVRTSAKSSFYSKVIDADTILTVHIMHEGISIISPNQLPEEQNGQNYYEVKLTIEFYELNRNEIHVQPNTVPERLQDVFGYAGNSPENVKEKWNFNRRNSKHFKLTPRSAQNKTNSVRSVALFKSKLYDVHNVNFTRAIHKALHLDQADSLCKTDIVYALDNCEEHSVQVDVKSLRNILFRTYIAGSTKSLSPKVDGELQRVLNEIDERFSNILLEFFKPIDKTQYYLFDPKEDFDPIDSDNEDNELEGFFNEDGFEGDEVMEGSDEDKELTHDAIASNPALNGYKKLEQGSSYRIMVQRNKYEPPPIFLKIAIQIDGQSNANSAKSSKTIPILQGNLTSVLVEGLRLPGIDITKQVNTALIHLVCSIMREAPDDPSSQDSRKEMLLLTRIILRKLRRRITAMVSEAVLNSLKRVYPVTENTVSLVKELFDHGSLPTKVISRITVPLDFIDNLPTASEDFSRELSKSPFLSVRPAGVGDIFFVVEGPSSSEHLAGSNSPASALRKGWSKREYSIPYWAIITLRGPSVTIEFHHPPKSSVLEVGHILDYLRNGLLRTAERVNQKILLTQLNETRTASRLLIPPDKQLDEAVSQLKPSQAEPGIQQNEGYKEVAWAPTRFPDGRFACPCYHRDRIYLPERLQRNAKEGLKLAMRVVVTDALNNHVVSNRKNTFVYSEGKKVYYLKLKESGDNALILEVYGLDKPSSQTSERLHNMIANKVSKLNLDTLMNVLQRNPQFKLQLYDLNFLCSKTDKAEESSTLDLPAEVMDPFLFLCYFRQNLLKFMYPLSVATQDYRKNGASFDATVYHPAFWGNSQGRFLWNSMLNHPSTFVNMENDTEDSKTGIVNLKLKRNDFGLMFISTLASVDVGKKGMAISFISLTSKKTGFISMIKSLDEAPKTAASAEELTNRRLSNTSMQSYHSASTGSTSYASPGKLHSQVASNKVPEHLRPARIEQDFEREHSGYSILLESWSSGEIDISKLKEYQFEAFNQTLHEYTFEALHIERPFKISNDGYASSIATFCTDFDEIISSSQNLSRPTPSFYAFELAVHHQTYKTQRREMLQEVSRVISAVQPELCQVSMISSAVHPLGYGHKFNKDNRLAPSTTSEQDERQESKNVKKDRLSSVLFAASQLTFDFANINSESSWLSASQYTECGFLEANKTIICKAPYGFVPSEFLFHPHLEVPVNILDKNWKLRETSTETNTSSTYEENLQQEVPTWKLFLGTEREYDLNEIQTTLMKKRNCFLILSLDSKKLSVRTYNWNFASLDILRKALIHCTAWIHVRMNLLQNILFQKMGLFSHAQLTGLTLRFLSELADLAGKAERVPLSVLKILESDRSFLLKDSRKVEFTDFSNNNTFSKRTRSKARPLYGNTDEYKRDDIVFRINDQARVTLEDLLVFIVNHIPPKKYLSYLLGLQKKERLRKGDLSIRAKHTNTKTVTKKTDILTAAALGRSRAKHKPYRVEELAKPSVTAFGAKATASGEQKSRAEESFNPEFNVHLLGMCPYTKVKHADLKKHSDILELHGEQLRDLSEWYRIRVMREKKLTILLSGWRRNYQMAASSFRYGITPPFQNTPKATRISEMDMKIILGVCRTFHVKRIPVFLATDNLELLNQFQKDVTTFCLAFLENSLDMILIPSGAGEKSHIRASNVIHMHKLVGNFLVIVEIEVNRHLVRCEMYTADYESVQENAVWKRYLGLDDKIVSSSAFTQSFIPELTDTRSLLMSSLSLYDLNISYLMKGLCRLEYSFGDCAFRFAEFYRDKMFGSFTGIRYHSFELEVEIPSVCMSLISSPNKVFKHVARNDKAYGCIGLLKKSSPSYLLFSSIDGSFNNEKVNLSELGYISIARAKAKQQIDDDKPKKNVLWIEFCLIYSGKEKIGGREGNRQLARSASCNEETILDEAKEQLQETLSLLGAKACVSLQRDTVWSKLVSTALAEDQVFGNQELEMLRFFSYCLNLKILDTSIYDLLVLNIKRCNLVNGSYFVQLYNFFQPHALMIQHTLILLPKPFGNEKGNFFIKVEQTAEEDVSLDLCWKDTTQAIQVADNARLFVTSFGQVLACHALDLSGEG